MGRSKFGGLIKKTAAVMLSMIMAFGAVSVLPNSVVKDNAVVAHAEKDRSGWASVAVNDCIFYYGFTQKKGVEGIVVEDADILNDEGIVEIPPTIVHNGVEYPVSMVGWGFLQDNKQVRNVIMPNTVKELSYYVLWNSSVEKLTISDNLEVINPSFCVNCPELKYENVTYNGTKIREVSYNSFGGSTRGMYNEKGAVCLNNWLLRYDPAEDTTHVKIADLGNNGAKIDSIGPDVVKAKSLTFVDMEGVKHIGNQNFIGLPNLAKVTNTDSIEDIGIGVFNSTPWLESEKSKGIFKVGTNLLYYKTDNKIIDLTSKELNDVICVGKEAFMDCKNADTLICSSKNKLVDGCFYVDYKGNPETPRDLMPVRSTYKIKYIYLDGKKLEFSKEDPEMPEWTTKNFSALEGTEWVKVNAEAKARALFEQLDMPFYGMENDKVGTLSKTEEFYNILKVHEYMSTYDYDVAVEYYNGVNAFLSGGKVACGGYADIAHYLLDCSGVEYLVMCSNSHAWEEVRIGDDWYECDFGWDAQYSHTYGLLGMSSAGVTRSKGSAHDWTYAADSWHLRTDEHITVPKTAERFLGDIDGNHKRDEKDLERLWEHIKGNIRLNGDPAIAADINYDGVIDITDGVLLENFLHGNAVDPENYPTDGLSPGFKAVFIESCEPEDIDPKEFIYQTTDRDGYLVLPEVMYDVPEGKKFGGWDYGQEGKAVKAGEKVKISNPYTVITPVWKNENDPDDDDSKTDDDSRNDDDSNTDTDGKWLLGDVDGNGTIDISDVSKLMNHINGVKALDEEEFLRADVNKSNIVEISDASAIVNHINGVKAIEGKV